MSYDLKDKYDTAQKMKFCIKNLLKKPLMVNFIFVQCELVDTNLH